MRKQQGFCELITPKTKEEFLLDYWQQLPLHVDRKSPKFYDGLFNMNEIDPLIMMGDSSPVYIRHGKAIDQFTHDTKSEDSSSPNVFGEVYRAFASGRSLIINSVERKSPKVNTICQDIADFFGVAVDASVFITPGGSSEGFGIHYDPVDMLILQTRGSKRWHFWKPQFLNPLSRIACQDYDPQMIGKPVIDIMLNQGDLLYVPRGWLHQALGTDATSVHLSLGIVVCSKGELALEVLHTAMSEDSELRESLPNLFQVDVNDVYNDLFKILNKISNNPQILNLAIEKLKANILKNISPRMDSHFERIEKIDSISLDTLICKRTALSVIIHSESDEEVLYIPGNKIEANKSLEPIFCFIQNRESFKPRDLPIGSEELRLSITKRFVAEGWLMIL